MKNHLGRKAADSGRRVSAPRAVETETSRWIVAALWAALIGLGLVMLRGQVAQRLGFSLDATAARQDATPVQALWLGDASHRPGAPASPAEVRLRATSGYTFQSVVSLGDPAPGGKTHSGHFEVSDLNRAGQVVLTSDLDRGEALYLFEPGAVRTLVRPGEPGPEGSIYGGNIWLFQSMNEAGMVVWAGRMGSEEAWICVYDPKTRRPRVVARPGLPAPGGGEFRAGRRHRAEVNDRGDVAFEAWVLARAGRVEVPGIFSRLDGKLRVVAREGTSAPGGTRFETAEAPGINNGRVIVFHATVSDREDLGVYRWRDGAVSAVAEPGPGAGHMPFHAAFYPQIDAQGRVVFVGQTEEGDGLYRWVDGVTTAIVPPGVSIPAVGVLQSLDFHRRRPFYLSPNGAVAFSGEAGGRRGVFLWERGRIRVVALAGVPLGGLGAPAEVGSLNGYPGGPMAPYDRPPGAGGPAALTGSDAADVPLDPTILDPIASGQAPAQERGSSNAPTPGLPPRGGFGMPGLGGPPGGYGLPGMGGVASPFGYFRGGSQGLALNDNGQILFLARLDGHDSVILATPQAGAATLARGR